MIDAIQPSRWPLTGRHFDPTRLIILECNWTVLGVNPSRQTEAGGKIMRILRALCQSSALAAIAGTVGIFVGTAAPATTTLTLTPQTYGYFKPLGGDQFQLSPFHSGVGTVANFSQVGRAISSTTVFNGDYAATIEFLIPEIPIDAILSEFSLTITPQFGTAIGDVQLRSYFSSATGADPSRIFAGSNLTNFLDLNHPVVTTDLFGGLTVNYLEDNPGQYLGFSFRETNPIDPRFCVTVCTATDIGSTVGSDFYTLPVLKISYDVPVPPPASDVPEPATWAMFIGGFGLVGAAMRRRGSSVRFS